MVRYLYKQCQTSAWLNPDDCPDPSVLGIIIKSRKDEPTIHPLQLNSKTIETFESIGAMVGFTMSSKVTAMLFAKLSPYQTDIFIQPQGFKVPIVESFEQAIRLAKSNLLAGSYCILRKDKVILIWSDSVKALLPQSANLEKLLVGKVSHKLSFQYYLNLQ